MSLENPNTTEDKDLLGLLGERYTQDRFERSFYQRDLASVPAWLARVLGDNLPDAVARPRNAEEVAAVVRHAAEHRIPLTPRAAATTVYWNAVPLRGGIVLDLTGLRGIIDINEAKSTVTVYAGTRFADLETLLARQSYALCSYPTSAPAATVGGWVNMMGYGIGSLKYGGLGQLVVRLGVILPDGRYIQATPDSQPPLAWFLGAEGTLGIVVEVELSIRRAAERTSRHLIAFPNLESLQKAALELSHSRPIPYTMHLSTKVHLHMLEMAGFKPPADQPVLMVSYEGDEAEVSQGRVLVRDSAAHAGGTELPEALAEAEWAERFYSLRLKRVGPTLLGSEFWLPLSKLTAYETDIERLSQRQNIPIGTYANIVMPDHATVMSLYPSNESRAVGYLFDLSLTNQLYRTAFRHGARPYGIGFWNIFYQRRNWSKTELADRRLRKHHLDPSNLMNPGKLYSPPILLSPFIFNLGMSVFAGLRSLLRIGTWSRSTAESKTRA